MLKPKLVAVRQSKPPTHHGREGIRLKFQRLTRCDRLSNRQLKLVGKIGSICDYEQKQRVGIRCRHVNEVFHISCCCPVNNPIRRNRKLLDGLG